MAINVQIQNESGGKIAELLDPDGAIASLVLSQQKNENSICLRFIDLYGNTSFNQLQLPRLIVEIKTATLTTSDPRVRQHATLLLDFLRSAIRLHTYVKLIGD